MSNREREVGYDAESGGIDATEYDSTHQDKWLQWRIEMEVRKVKEQYGPDTTVKVYYRDTQPSSVHDLFIERAIDVLVFLPGRAVLPAGMKAPWELEEATETGNE